MVMNEFEMPRAIKAKSFVPRQWLKTTSATLIEVVPPNICHKLPMINLNKNKDGKYKLNPESLPEKNSVDRETTIDSGFNNV